MVNCALKNLFGALNVPARCTDDDVAAVEPLPLELEVLAPNDEAGTQPMELAHLTQRLKYLRK